MVLSSFMGERALARIKYRVDVRFPHALPFAGDVLCKGFLSTLSRVARPSASRRQHPPHLLALAKAATVFSAGDPQRREKRAFTQYVIEPLAPARYPLRVKAWLSY